MEYCTNSETFKKTSDTAKQNRSTYHGPSHTGGSIPVTEHIKRLRASVDHTNIDSEAWRVFIRTHTRDGLGETWINDKSADIAREYQRLIAIRDANLEAGTAESSEAIQSTDDLYVTAAGGVNPKGRIYGLGTQAHAFKPSQASRASQPTQPSAPQPVIPREVMDRLDRQDNELQEVKKSIALLERYMLRTPSCLNFDDSDATQPPSHPVSP